MFGSRIDYAADAGDQMICWLAYAPRIWLRQLLGPPQQLAQH